MFGFGRRRKDNTEERVKKLNEPLDNKSLSKSLEKNIAEMRSLFKDDDMLKFRYIENQHNSKLKYYIVFTDALVDCAMINRSVVHPLISSNEERSGASLMDVLMDRVLLINEIEKANQFKDIVEAVTYGATILFAEGESDALILNTKHFAIRSVEEPNNEKTLSGPREGYTEVIMANLSLVRRKFRTNDFKMRFHKIGRRTRTDVCICYLESLVEKQVLDELYRRLNTIDIDGILDANYITEMIKDSPWSPFPSIGYTERPDVTAGRLLEGRIAIFVDGTPVVLTVPYLFIENLQSGEDYYMPYLFASFTRALRVIGLLLTLVVPGFYIAIVGFHQEMLPTNLIVSIAASRKSVPLPATIECFVMLGVFELIRETGTRMPSNIGQALSIVGALVIGEAAVTANLVAPPMIIVVGLTGITSLLVPKMPSAVIYGRLLLLIMSSSFGFYGLALGATAIMIHVLNLRSFGVPQISLAGNFNLQRMKDSLIRAPWFNMKTRPNMLSEDKVREAMGDAKSKT